MRMQTWRRYLYFYGRMSEQFEHTSTNFGDYRSGKFYSGSKFGLFELSGIQNASSWKSNVYLLSYTYLDKHGGFYSPTPQTLIPKVRRIRTYFSLIAEKLNNSVIVTTRSS